MSDLSIAQQIANKRLQRRKLLKLAQGTQGPQSSAAPTGPAAPPQVGGGIKPPAAGQYAGYTGGLPAAKPPGARPQFAGYTGGAPSNSVPSTLNPPLSQPPVKTHIKTPMHPAAEIASGFVGGMGQGVKNMFGGVADFARGATRGLISPLAAEMGRSLNAESGDRAAGDAYADDMYKHFGKAWGDVANSFGRFVGVHDAWDPSTGQYRGAQPADATKQHTQEIGQKYFGDTRSSTLGRAYTATNALADGAAEAIPLAMAGPAAGAQLMRVPGAAAVANTATANPLVRRTLTYGMGLPVSAPSRPGLFLASNMGQNYALGANLPGAEYLPANIVDTATRETVGDFAPEVFDAMRWGKKLPVGITATLQPFAEMRRDSVEYGAEQKQLAADQSASTLKSLEQQYASSVTPDILNQLDDNSYSQLLSLQSALEGKSGEEQIPLLQQMNTILAGGAQQNPAVAPTQQPEIAAPNAETPAAAPPAETAATPEAPPQQAEAPPITQPDTAAAVSAALPADATPEMRAEVDSGVAGVTATIEQNPDIPQKLQTEGGVEEFNKTNEPNAIKQIADERMQQNPGPENPGDWATWLNDTVTWATQKWSELGIVGQLAFGLGMPLGVIGLLGGGLSGVLTSVLGFGVAGLAAASTGALGETAQGAVTGAGEAVANAGAAVTGTGAPAASVEPPVPLAQDESLKLLQELTAAPDGTQYIAQNRDKFNQFAAMHDADLSSVAQQMSPESRATVNKILTGLKTQVDTGITDVGGLWPSIADNWPGTRAKLDSVGLKSTSELPALQEKINRMLQVLNSAQQEVAAPTGEKKSMFNSKSASHIVAQHLAIAALQKAARCWSGYEPVPGKKPYSNDSCRPIGGKKKKKKTEKKAVQAACPGGVCRPQRPAQPEYTETPFDVEHTKAVFDEFGIKYSPNASELTIYNQARRVGTYGPGETPNLLQESLGAPYDSKFPKPPRPVKTPPKATAARPGYAIIDPPALTPSPFKAAPRPQRQPPANAAPAKPATPPPASVKMPRPLGQ